MDILVGMWRIRATGAAGSREYPRSASARTSRLELVDVIFFESSYLFSRRSQSSLLYEVVLYCNMLYHTDSEPHHDRTASSTMAECHFKE